MAFQYMNETINSFVQCCNFGLTKSLTELHQTNMQSHYSDLNTPMGLMYNTKEETSARPTKILQSEYGNIEDCDTRVVLCTLHQLGIRF